MTTAAVKLQMTRGEADYFLWLVEGLDFGTVDDLMWDRDLNEEQATSVMQAVGALDPVLRRWRTQGDAVVDPQTIDINAVGGLTFGVAYILDYVAMDCEDARLSQMAYEDGESPQRVSGYRRIESSLAAKIRAIVPAERGMGA